MITRTSHYAQDPAYTVHVVIADTFDDGLRAVSQDLLEHLSAHTSGRVEVYAAREQFVDVDLALLEAPADVPVHFVDADPSYTPDTAPRAEVNISGTTWDTGDHGTSIEQRTGYRRVDRGWEIRVCPPGVDPRVHEIAQTLMWDAEEAGAPLTTSDAHAIAKHLCN